jgi:hypothetical protein
MADVLLIFVREDLAPAAALAEQCEKAGYSIFTGSPLEARGEDYHAAIVIWSESAESSAVFSESAARAVASGKALIASFADEEPPQSFDDAPAFDLYDWDGEAADVGFAALFEALKRAIEGAEPELVLTVAAEPEALELQAVELELAAVLPELDQPEPDFPEPDLPELELPDLEQPQIDEPKPPPLELVELTPTRTEPPRLVLVDLEPAPEEFVEPDLTESFEPAPEPPVLQIVASNEAFEVEEALAFESAPAPAPEPAIVIEQAETIQPAVNLAESDIFSPPLTEAPPGLRRTRGKKPQRARRAPAARPAAARTPRTRDVWRDVAQAALVSAVVFVAVMQIGHWTLGATAVSPVAVTQVHQPLAQFASLAVTPAAAEIAAPELASPAVAEDVAAAPPAEASRSAAPVRRAPSRLPRSGFIQATYAPEITPDVPVAEEPEDQLRQRADLRRYRHGSKG